MVAMFVAMLVAPLAIASTTYAQGSPPPNIVIILADDRTQARRVEETRRDFVANVSHELKTPLTAIRGYAEGLDEGAFNSDEAARIILMETGRLERLVRDLLDIRLTDLDEQMQEAVARLKRAL